ncbi:hypothetical protein A5844_001343 [Enterococcus sp. 10A9_DIV0425]|uniref:ABC transporter domain-containing protein n=1 Tax=Candidatus Enterococcus wittei TaxID=1987383 RepID=A0A242K0L9_9ENTE|nr:ATP-binding cassette domain-containing protein [Enterococcus sp. 10A9_DIV0425]OTP11209.1 hypothetical protein A5844_001343 [Enterococcus sp. 10A9_DIV0425]THE15762.1 ATP-binding cassette domain-containing protein [Enterococcus hirae]
MNILEVQGVKKAFKEKEVLKGIDLQVEKGEIFALLGSNGAGKTTLISILATLEKMDAGKASINGFDVEKEAGNVRQSISLTGQFTAVDEILTGRENLELIAKLRREKEPKVVADEMLKKVSLEEAADKPVGTYSGGMKRRIDIGMSLIGKPDLIFLDEPTTGLDPEARQEIYQMIVELAADGTTFFLTTQYLDEAEKLADRIAILHNGIILSTGRIEELKKLFPSPKVEYVEKQPSLEEIFLAIIHNKEGI